MFERGLFAGQYLSDLRCTFQIGRDSCRILNPQAGLLIEEVYGTGRDRQSDVVTRFDACPSMADDSDVRRSASN